MNIRWADHLLDKRLVAHPKQDLFPNNSSIPDQSAYFYLLKLLDRRLQNEDLDLGASNHR